MQGLEAALEELKAEVLENEGLISTHQEKLYGTKNAINIKEQGIDFSRRKIADLAARREKDLAEGEALKRREGETDGEIAALRAAAAEAEERIGTLRKEVAEGAQALEELRRMDRTCRQALEEKKVRYIDIVTEKAKLKNMVAGLARMVEDFGKREAREVREIEENGKRSAELGRTLEKLRSGLAADEEGFAELGRAGGRRSPTSWNAPAGSWRRPRKGSPDSAKRTAGRHRASPRSGNSRRATPGATRGSSPS